MTAWDWREPSRTDDEKTPESAEALNGADTGACMHVDPAFTW
ncbi:hypothetical protein OG322_20310 [Streptomyces sp. NBC_01260]|nr:MULTISPECIES: hypothetical protein [unclassified Streptomyces]MCX4771656.1 hypothetical protein [Streptomyces sp. NBC_01285]